MDLDLVVVTVLPANVSPAECLNKMPQEFRRVMVYLLTLQRPDVMTDKAFNSFNQFALRFLVYETPATELHLDAVPGLTH